MKKIFGMLAQLAGLAMAVVLWSTPASANEGRDDNWTRCANEGGRCNFSGVRTVRYGADGRYETREIRNGTECNNETFGDPVPGLTKYCEIAATQKSAWIKCADEGGRCNFAGVRTIRYGADGKYVTREFRNSVECTNQTFGDPIEGVTKSCEVGPSAVVASGWTKCAEEGGRCNFAGTRVVRYGAKDKFIAREVRNSVTCDNKTFGDPIEGVEKYCEIGPVGTAIWAKCADEGERCNFSGVRVVRYGARDQYVVREMRNGADCNNQTFGDPIDNIKKQCELGTHELAGWIECAKEGQVCKFNGLRQVRYGTKGRFTQPKNFLNDVECSNDTFGDPAGGMSKYCEYGPEISVTWTQCANEGGNCKFTGTRIVRYGTRDRYTMGEFMNGVACSNAVFGDPVPGRQKRCDFGPEVEIDWDTCAKEGEQCNFEGTRQVRYGADGKYAVREVRGGTACNNQVFGDPIPGISKRCEIGSRVR